MCRRKITTFFIPAACDLHPLIFLGINIHVIFRTDFSFRHDPLEDIFSVYISSHQITSHSRSRKRCRKCCDVIIDAASEVGIYHYLSFIGCCTDSNHVTHICREIAAGISSSVSSRDNNRNSFISRLCQNFFDCSGVFRVRHCCGNIDDIHIRFDRISDCRIDIGQ